VSSRARAYLPPAIVPPLRRFRNAVLRRVDLPEWEYVPEGWDRERSDPLVKGWNVNAIADAHRERWEEWVEALSGTGTLGVDYIRNLRRSTATDHVITNYPWAHNAVMSYGYVLALAATTNSISILDWGGGIGQYFLLSQRLLPEVEIDYHCKEMPVLCELGRELCPDATFYDDDSWRNRRYDLVVATSAIQLNEDWQGVLRGLASVADRYLYVARFPVVFHHPSFVVLQRAYDLGFETEFLGWYLNRDEFVGCAADAGMELVREFVMLDQTPDEGVPEHASHRAFLFEPAASRGRSGQIA
jgi:putative methyltransferase (TIGR04325 family)